MLDIFSDLLSLALALLDRIHAAHLEGFPLLLALLAAFFVGAYSAVRRMRLDARAFWRLVLNQDVDARQEKNSATQRTDDASGKP